MIGKFMSGTPSVNQPKGKRSLVVSHSLPPPPTVKNWIILSTDLSLSRSGVVLLIGGDEDWDWRFVGSVKPQDTSSPSWMRSTGTEMFLESLIHDNLKGEDLSMWGVLLVTEVPTPMNDYLNIIHGSVNTRLFPFLSDLGFKEIFSLKINASTMRSTLGLAQRGNDNKKENQAKALGFLTNGSSEFPGLDSDACDAVLFAILGQWSLLLFSQGIQTPLVPDNFRTRFCDSTPVAKGKGKNAYVVPRGVLLNEEYWFQYVKTARSFTIKDARIPSRKRLDKVSFPI